MKIVNEIAKLTDIKLLEFLCSSDDDEFLFAEFTSRFLPLVKNECQQICKKRKLHSHIGIEIAIDTLERVKKYKSFCLDKIKIKNDRKAILVYLFRISNSLFNDYHRQNNFVAIYHKTYFDNLLDSIDVKTDILDLKNKKDIAIKIFGCLNENERKIVIADLEFKRYKKYLPDVIIESLSNEMGVKKDSLRKIRERAIDKIKNAINEINQQ